MVIDILRAWGLRTRVGQIPLAHALVNVVKDPAVYFDHAGIVWSVSERPEVGTRVVASRRGTGVKHFIRYWCPEATDARTSWKLTRIEIEHDGVEKLSW